MFSFFNYYLGCLSHIDPKLVAFALITRALFTGTDIIGVSPLLKVGLKPRFNNHFKLKSKIDFA